MPPCLISGEMQKAGCPTAPSAGEDGILPWLCATSKNWNLAGLINGKPNRVVHAKGSLWEGAGREAD